jgi:RNA polymerase sigma factor (sigma-70 family)
LKEHEAGVSDYEARFSGLFTVAYRVGFRILGERNAADDIAQESLTRAFVRWRRVRNHAEPWVARVASNLALDVVRRGPAPQVVPLGSTEPLVAERIDLQRALVLLPRRQREVVVLRYCADLSETDVAVFLRCSPGTVKTHAHRGLAALREALTPIEGGT